MKPDADAGVRDGDARTARHAARVERRRAAGRAPRVVVVEVGERAAFRLAVYRAVERIAHGRLRRLLVAARPFMREAARHAVALVAEDRAPVREPEAALPVCQRETRSVAAACRADGVIYVMRPVRGHRAAPRGEAPLHGVARRWNDERAVRGDARSEGEEEGGGEE